MRSLRLGRRRGPVIWAGLGDWGVAIAPLGFQTMQFDKDGGCT